MSTKDTAPDDLCFSSTRVIFGPNEDFPVWKLHISYQGHNDHSTSNSSSLTTSSSMSRVLSYGDDALLISSLVNNLETYFVSDSNVNNKKNNKKKEKNY